MVPGKERGYLFTARAGFICNLVFVLSLVFRYARLPQFLVGFGLVAGWGLSPLLNTVLIFWTLAFIIKARPNPAPVWLVMVNFVAAALELVFFILLT